MRHLQFVVEIGHRAQAADDDAGADALGVVDRQAAELVNPSPRLEVADGLADHLDPLVGREQRGILVRIVSYCDDHFLEDRDAAPDDVDVPVVDRVERPRVDSALGYRILAFVHHARRYRASAPPARGKGRSDGRPGLHN